MYSQARYHYLVTPDGVFTNQGGRWVEVNREIEMIRDTLENEDTRVRKFRDMYPDVRFTCEIVDDDENVPNG